LGRKEFAVQPSLRLGRVAGIEIGLHYTWLLIAVLITGSFVGYFSETYPHWPAKTTWSAAIVISLLFFGSIVLHEFAHAIVAKTHGMPVRTITLFALGGVTHIEKQAATPAAEFWMGIAGPTMSAGLGLLCGWLASLANGEPSIGMSPSIAILLSLSSLNFMLAVFNLIPGFPLDGGRILRALVWWLSSDENRGTRISARAGQSVALILFAVGLWEFFSGENVSGLWLGLLGWFLLDAATASYQQAEVLTGLRGVRVGDVMSHDCLTVQADMPLQRFADEVVLKTGRRCYAVDQHSMIVGLVTPADLAKVERARWISTTIGEVARPLHQLQSISPDASVVDALLRMGREDLNQLPVIAAGRMEGMLSRSHIMQLLQTRTELSM
jgi:Zn-dependent protease/predicted transcriptional regulator